MLFWKQYWWPKYKFGEDGCSAVEGDTVKVDPEPEINLTENLRTLLGSDTTEADTYTIRRDVLARDRYADVAVFWIDADPDVRDD